MTPRGGESVLSPNFYMSTRFFVENDLPRPILPTRYFQAGTPFDVLARRSRFNAVASRAECTLALVALVVINLPNHASWA